MGTNDMMWKGRDQEKVKDGSYKGCGYLHQKMGLKKEKSGKKTSEDWSFCFAHRTAS